MGEFFMIVLGVLTALALDQLAQNFLHARAAQATKAMLDAEIRANLGTIRHIRKIHLERAESMAALGELLLRDIKARVPDAQIIAHFSREVAGGKYFGMNVNTPILDHTAWDVAVADQSASWMESAQLRRYASVYSMHNRLPEHVRAKMPHVLDGPDMVDVESDLEMGLSDPRALYRAIKQTLAAFQMVDANLQTAETLTLRAFPQLANAK